MIHVFLPFVNSFFRPRFCSLWFVGVDLRAEFPFRSLPAVT